jgi:hypothetical protein
MFRKAPPSGPFYTSGEVKGTVSKGDLFVVKERREVDTLFGSYSWAKVQRLDPNTQKAVGDEGWIYTGKIGGKSYVESVKRLPSQEGKIQLIAPMIPEGQ